MLNEGGPAALSMREVARRTGCTHQAPYHYFADRECILAALVCEGFDELARQLRAANALFRTEGVRATLLASAQAYVHFATTHPGVFRIMFRPDMCNPARFPDVIEAGMRARAELEHLNVIINGNQADPSCSIILWSYVHGLSCLLLDGPLEASFATAQDREAQLRAMSEAFADRMLGHRP